MSEPLEILAKQTAEAHGLDPALVCAMVEQESAWQPWATRFEPGFLERYVDPGSGLTGVKVPSTVQIEESISWGLLQLMGASARALGFTDRLPSLCDPAAGLEWGCRWFLVKLKTAGGDVTKALLYWNGGGNPQYPAQVLARKGKYEDTQG